MRAYLRRFRAYRQLESDVERLRQELTTKTETTVKLQDEVTELFEENESLVKQVTDLSHELEIERSKRIAAESIAVERQRVIDRPAGLAGVLPGDHNAVELEKFRTRRDDQDGPAGA